MTNTIKSKKDENCFIIEDKKGIVSRLLDAEFYSGIFLERQKLITEFLEDLNECKNLDPKIRLLIEKWEKRREKE